MRALPASAQEHEAAGRYVAVRGQRVFVREAGAGAPVLLVHGVPASSFLYRKVIPRLAARGLRPVAFDFPGLGLSDKPHGAAYDWHALAGWMDAIVDELGIAPVHLVVHDIGGPIGFEWATRHPEKLRSLTILNTLLDVAVFRRPFPMWLYVVPAFRHVAVRAQSARLLAPVMRRIGLKHAEAMTLDEIASYPALLRHNDGLRPFLDVMAGFVLTAEHGDFLREGLKAHPAPIQLVWREHEVAIPRHQLEHIRTHLPLRHSHFVDARHFLQQDAAGPLAGHVADFCAEVDARS